MYYNLSSGIYTLKSIKICHILYSKKRKNMQENDL